MKSITSNLRIRNSLSISITDSINFQNYSFSLSIGQNASKIALKRLNLYSNLIVETLSQMSETFALTNSLCSQMWTSGMEILVSFQWRKYGQKSELIYQVKIALYQIFQGSSLEV